MGEKCFNVEWEEKICSFIQYKIINQEIVFLWSSVCLPFPLSLYANQHGSFYQNFTDNNGIVDMKTVNGVSKLKCYCNLVQEIFKVIIDGGYKTQQSHMITTI